jgi:biopolymer transport protein ExbD
MRRSKHVHKRHQSHEFELDLAPLLAVMVKLVPVMLISSAFVQIMTIQSDLPGALKQVIADSEKQPTQVRLVTTPKNEVKVVVSGPKGSQTKQVAAKPEGAIDFDGTHAALLEVKKEHPEVFHISIGTAKSTTYQDMVKLMDEARKAKTPGTEFPYQEKGSKETKTTPWMFPEVMIETSTEAT